MKKILWIHSRFPTIQQMDEMTANGEELVSYLELGSMYISSSDDLDEYFDMLNEAIKEIQPTAIYGVFDQPVFNAFNKNPLQYAYNNKDKFIPVYKSLNKETNVEDKFNFEHWQFIYIGAALNVNNV